MEWLLGGSILVLLIVVIVLLVRKQQSPEASALLDERARALESEKARAESLQRELTAAQAEASAQKTLGAERQQQAQRLDAALKESGAACDRLKTELAQAKADISGRDSKIEALQQQAAQDRAAQAKELQELHEKFNAEFQNLANRIFEEKSAKFTQLNGESVKNLLAPFGLSLKEFKEAVGHYNEESIKERTALGAQVKGLVELNKSLGTEARNLTRALTSDSQQQGRWGEITLASLLEKSGLVKDLNYFLQCQLKDADGKPLKSQADEKMRPDAVVKLPDDHDVIIDAKCSLTAFARATAEDCSEEDRAAALKEHIASVYKHVDELSDKAYDDYRKSLNFVLLFIPSEAAYVAAIRQDPSLWQYAYKERTLIVSPMTLLISLHLIADLWKRENQERHVQEIADRGSKLYEKFINFAEVFVTMDKKLTDLRNAYNDANKLLSTGRSNLVWQAEQLKALGVNTKKPMPESLVKNVDLSEAGGEKDANN